MGLQISAPASWQKRAVPEEKQASSLVISGAVLFLLMLRARFFFLDEFVDESRHCSTAKTPGRLRLGPIGISHKSQIERLLGSNIRIVVESDLCALAAL